MPNKILPTKDAVDALQTSMLHGYNHDNQREAALAILEILGEKGYVVVKKEQVSVSPKCGNI